MRSTSYLAGDGLDPVVADEEYLLPGGNGLDPVVVDEEYLLPGGRGSGPCFS